MNLFNFRNFLKLLCCFLPVLNELPSRMGHFTSLQDILLLHLPFSNLCLKEHPFKMDGFISEKIAIYHFPVQYRSWQPAVSYSFRPGFTPSQWVQTLESGFVPYSAQPPSSHYSCLQSIKCHIPCLPSSLVDSSLIFPYTSGACSYDTPVWYGCVP